MKIPITFNKKNQRKANVKLVCLHCGKSFSGDNIKFCSQGCRDAYIVSIDRRVREAVKNDSSHTRKMSTD